MNNNWFYCNNHIHLSQLFRSLWFLWLFLLLFFWLWLLSDRFFLCLRFSFLCRWLFYSLFNHFRFLNFFLNNWLCYWLISLFWFRRCCRNFTDDLVTNRERTNYYELIVWIFCIDVVDLICDFIVEMSRNDNDPVFTGERIWLEVNHFWKFVLQTF